MVVNLRNLRVTIIVLSLCGLFTGCALRTHTFAFSPGQVENRNVYPWRVGVVVDNEFMPYKIKYRYWSSTSFTWPLAGLPEAFVRTLSPHFLSVEPIYVSRSMPTEQYDLIARMAIDRLHFDGALTTVSDDDVDLDMTFAVERPSGGEVFRTTVSVRASSPYLQRCAFCRPDPPEAFTDAFARAFAKLSETLAVSDLRSHLQD